MATTSSIPQTRILLVEDEALVAMLIEDQLIELGLKVVGPVASASRAIELCYGEPIDGGLLDVNLGDGQRSDSVADLLASRNIPFAFVTGYGDAGISTRFADRAVLQKPFALADLRRLIEGIFGDRHKLHLRSEIPRVPFRGGC